MTTSKAKQTSGIWVVLFLYWVILLMWQNVRGDTVNRGGVDLLIKFALLFMISVYCFFRCNSIHRRLLIYVLGFAAIVIMTQLTRGSTSVNDIMYYFFPIWMCLLVFVIGGNFQINRQQLFSLLNCVIFAVGYIVLYALIFCTDSFLNAASVTNAYGNELRSFLFSSHEYGLYLCFGSVSIILLLEMNKEMSNLKKTFYVIALAAFLLNLILTFSRTSLVSFMIVLVFFVLFFHGTKGGKVMLYAAVGIVLVILILPPLREYFADIVFKKNNDANRGEILDLGFQMFKDGTLMEKLFGYPYEYQTRYLRYVLRYNSFHNALMQILVANGLVGVIFELSLIGITTWTLIRTIGRAGENKKLVKLFFGFLLSGFSYMMFQTTVLFSSSIDSFFLTLFAIIIPQYVCNSIQAGTFDLVVPKNKPAPSKYLRR